MSPFLYGSGSSEDRLRRVHTANDGQPKAMTDGPELLPASGFGVFVIESFSTPGDSTEAWQLPGPHPHIATIPPDNPDCFPGSSSPVSRFKAEGLSP